MKTEPTEARKKLSEKCDNMFGRPIIRFDFAEEAIKIAFKEGQSNPKIRQLEWTFTKNEGFSFTPFVNYRIYYWKTAYNENKAQLIYNKKSNAALNGHDGHELIGEYDDCDSAIRAAQTDFEKRVKECLE
ncbi:MAG TPA: hypothetical protein DEP71_07355 [Porphyromonadaceae bacterium]|nr:hypothetical protein [Porphyromonadaceae bacterium]